MQPELEVTDIYRSISSSELHNLCASMWRRQGGSAPAERLSGRQ